MTWLAPWALLGIVGIALPTLIHLLGRGHAQRQRFPSLRFLQPSRLLPTQRTKIHDPWLLVVRAAIVALAAIALARPLIVSASRKRALDRGTAVVAIVDSGWAMQGATTNGRRAVDVARDSARALVAAAQSGLVVESAQPRRALIGAVNWLAREGRRSEVVIYSRFSSGTIDSMDLAVVPPSVGLRLMPVGPLTIDSIARTAANGRAIVASVGYDSGATTARWTSEGQTASVPIRIFAAQSDAAVANALNATVGHMPVALPIDTSQTVAVVFPGAPERARLETGASPIRTAWMVDRIAAMPTDLQRTRTAEAQLDGRTALLFFPTSSIESLESARLVAAIVRSGSRTQLEGRGVDPIAPATLARWNRAASVSDAQLRYRPDDGRSDARWVWGFVIALLVLEVWMRRARRAAAEGGVEARAHAA